MLPTAAQNSQFSTMDVRARPWPELRSCPPPNGARDGVVTLDVISNATVEDMSKTLPNISTLHFLQIECVRLKLTDCTVIKAPTVS
jgi:hypothetical protein